MFWIFLLVASLGLIIFKLGVYSVLVSIFVSGTKLMILLAIGFIAMAVWRRYRAS